MAEPTERQKAIDKDYFGRIERVAVDVQRWAKQKDARTLEEILWPMVEYGKAQGRLEMFSNAPFLSEDETYKKRKAEGRDGRDEVYANAYDKLNLKWLEKYQECRAEILEELGALKFEPISGMGYIINYCDVIRARDNKPEGDR